MTWNVYLMRAAGFDSVRDVPEGWSPPPLGPRSAVITSLEAALPTVHFPQPAAGTLHGDGFSIDFALGDSEQTAGILLVVHGDGAAALDAIGRAADALQAAALAADLGDFIYFDRDPETGRHVWRNPPAPEGWVAPA